MEAVLSGRTYSDVEWIRLGWKAAAQSLNSKSSGNINSVTESFASGTGLPQSILASATNNDALAVFGLYLDDSTCNIMQDSDFTAGNLVLFGPYTQSTGMRQWSSNVYFMSPDPVSELIALMFSARIVSTSTAYVYDPEAHTVLYAKLPDLVEPTTTTITSTATPTTTTTTTTTTTLPPCKLTTSPAPTAITTIAPTTTAPPTLPPPASHGGSSHSRLYVLLVILPLLLVAAVLFAIHLCSTVIPCFGGDPFNNVPIYCDAPTTTIFAEVVKWTDLQHLAPDAATESVTEYRSGLGVR